MDILTTEIWLLYLFIILNIVFFTISIFTWYSKIDIVAIFTMIISMIFSFKISNLFIDGTLTKTTYFLSSTDVSVPVTEVIRNSAASGIFEFFAIGQFIILVAMLISQFTNSTENGDGDYEE